MANLKPAVNKLEGRCLWLGHCGLYGRRRDAWAGAAGRCPRARGVPCHEVRLWTRLVRTIKGAHHVAKLEST
eukprot:832149-Prymnesium_polylepis.2